MSGSKPTVPGSSKKGSEFMCHIKFKNSLPDPPIPCKMIAVPTDLSKYLGYAPTDLEREHRYQVPADILKTPLVDMVDLDALKPQIHELLAVEDEPLLVSFEVLERKKKAAAAASTSAATSSLDVTAQPSSGLDMNAARRPDVTWLRRTEYISSESVKASPNMPSSTPKKRPQQPTEEIQDRAELVRRIEDGFGGFDEAKLEAMVHPSKPALKAVSTIPVLPIASEDWTGPSSFSQCLFDTDPSATQGLGEVATKPGSEKTAILRAMSNPNNPSDSFVWYYLERAGSEPGQYIYTRDYDIQRNDKSLQSYVLLVDREETVARLVPVTSQFHLKKRRMKASDSARQPHLLHVTRHQSE